MLLTKLANSCKIHRNTTGKQSNVSYSISLEQQRMVCSSNVAPPRIFLLSAMQTGAMTLMTKYLPPAIVFTLDQTS